MAERKGKKSQKKAEQVQEMLVLAKNKQDVLERGELDQYYFGEGTHYDIYKKLGAQMFTEGFDLKAELDTLNTKWAEARTKLGIK